MNQNNTNMGMENEEITIDLMDLFQVVFKKLHLVLLAGIIAALVAVLVTKLFMTPVYTSTTKMYVLSKQDANSAVTSSDLQAGSQLTKDYMELIKSRSVMEQVISQLQLDMSVDKLSGEITVSNTADTRILSISVENENPKLAKEIADAVRESASVQITQITDADAVNMVEEGNLPKNPTSPNTMKNTMLGGILGIFLALGAIVLIYILDDTIKTPDDVERYLGLTVLTSIPIASGNTCRKEGQGIVSTEIYKKEWKEVSGKEKEDAGNSIKWSGKRFSK